MPLTNSSQFFVKDDHTFPIAPSMPSSAFVKKSFDIKPNVRSDAIRPIPLLNLSMTDASFPASDHPRKDGGTAQSNTGTAPLSETSLNRNIVQIR